MLEYYIIDLAETPPYLEDKGKIPGSGLRTEEIVLLVRFIVACIDIESRWNGFRDPLCRDPIGVDTTQYK